jgi:hypothetical protein
LITLAERNAYIAKEKLRELEMLRREEARLRVEESIAKDRAKVLSVNDAISGVFMITITIAATGGEAQAIG